MRAPTRHGLVSALAHTGFAIALLALLTLPVHEASAADWSFPDLGWEGSRAEEGVAIALDAVFVRPLASARFGLGALMFVPAYLFSLPMGREGFDGAYDTLIAQPAEYAFERELGDF